MKKPTKVVLAGGSGHIGAILATHFHRQRDEVVVLSRLSRPAPWRVVQWDGASLGNWTRELEDANVVINLAGRSVNCRYSQRNREQIMSSRVQPTRLIGDAIARLAQPPRLWMNASTATIYRHALDRDMDEDTGEYGGHEPGTPAPWKFSIDVATNWEHAFFSAPTPFTRRIALRSAVVMSPQSDGPFDILSRLVRLGLGGAAGSGRQYVSWVHDLDFVHAIQFLIQHEEFEGAVNIASPNPLPNRSFMGELRRAWGSRIGLPAPGPILSLGAMLLRTEPELILKSRRVVPGRLCAAGFHFQFPYWREAAGDLVDRLRTQLPA